MKKLLLAAAFIAIATTAYAGYDFSLVNLSQETYETGPVITSSHVIPLYDTAATGGDADFIAATNIQNIPAGLVAVSADTTATCATNGNGRINYISAAAGTTNLSVTLPAATGSGCKYTFLWSAAPNSASTQVGDVIQVTGNDSFNGIFVMSQDSGAGVQAFETASDTDKLTFTSTQGAAVANVWIEFWDYATDKYQIGGSGLIGTGTEATPGATGQRS